MALSVALAAVLGPVVPAGAQVQPYRTNDPGGFWNILPAGAGGHANGGQVTAFVAACPPGGDQSCPDAPRPAHSADELSMYGDLVYASPRLRPEDLGKFFKDASFGVRNEQVERTYSPREDVTIVRDSFGVPHVYGKTRGGARFGLGYVGAEDRLFVMDVLRHAGRAQLSSFAGGAEGNREMDREQWEIAPYTEDDLQQQYERGDEVYGQAGRQLQEDVQSYVAGINAYIEEARADPSKMPGEYGAIVKADAPEEWKVTDVIATASLIGGIFGKGGGRELESALLLQEAQRRFGRRRGRRVWADLRTAEDPEAPVTVLGRRFPYQRPSRRPRRGSLGMPDPGSVRMHEIVASASGGSSRAQGLGGGLLRSRGGGSNALLVSARESRSGHPLAVMGPQTGYFAPNLLMDVDVHAPSIDARGATFAGIGLYVLLGRGRDYAWSATSAGQDLVDTFAVELCEPDGRRPTLQSMHYRFRGACRPIEVLERQNSWIPTPADQTPAGSETLRAERTQLGLVTARATIKRRPVAYVKLRATYFHEADSALAFAELNDPAAIRGARDFQRAVHKIGFTFNWFYAGHRSIAYFNSGWNPVRARGVSNHFPVSGRFPWRGYNPDLHSAAYTGFRQHPRVINQRYIANWNNKQARGYRAADDNFAYGSVYRSQSLESRIRRGIRGRRKMSLVQLVDAMEDAGTVDLRATRVLPHALRVIGRPRDPAVRPAVRRLRAWVRAGGHRRDRNRDGAYEHADAIRILDAWWPRWVAAQFRPTLGGALFVRLEDMLDPDDEPNAAGSHVGSAYNGGWYHYAQRDLRTLLRRRVKGRYSRIYCGGTGRRNGSLRRCRGRLRDSLKSALTVDSRALYRDEDCEDYERSGDQWCFDAVLHRPIGAITQPLIHWINRPTFQQVVEIQGPAPR